MTRIGLIACLIVAPAAAAAQAVTPPAFSTYLMDEAREVALAKSAAPASVTGKAGIYVLRKDATYHLVTLSQNGFHCLVQRSFTVPSTDAKEFYEPRLVAPICFNAEGSSTLMQRDLFIAPLVGTGTPLADIRRAEADAYASGALKYPSRAVIAYMLSSAHWLGAKVAHWHPHVMIWAPGLSPADVAPTEIGSFGLDSGLPVMDPRYGPKQPLLVIPVAKSIDPVLTTAR